MISEPRILCRERQTKIVPTLGPASSDKKTIRALFDAGADVFRLNFSHGSHEDHRARLALIREIEREIGHPITVLADLQGQNCASEPRATRTRCAPWWRNKIT